MNAIEFVKEVKDSNICPKDFDKIYEEFKFYQKAALDTLDEFHRVCEKNNIPYFVQYGSLLGLIRDGGQIPWDYDVDVVVPYSEKANLISALEKDLGKGFYYYCIEKNPKCRHMITRIAPIGYKTESLHVDVFYYIGVPSDEKEREIFVKRIKKIATTRYYRYVNISEETRGSIKKFVKYTLRKAVAKLKNMDKLMKEYYDLCNKYDVYESKYNVSADWFAPVDLFESKDLWETTIIETNDGKKLRAPVKYEKILTQKYKDYKKIFPLKDRLKELMYHYSKLHRQNKDKIENKKNQI